MKKLFLAFAVLAASAQAFAVENMTLTHARTSTGSVVKVTACAHDALAICSVTRSVNGGPAVEYIDDYDHGRQLQTALSFGGAGEAYNPTEAGGSALDTQGRVYNGINPSQSFSEARGWAKDSEVQFRTSTRAGYWQAVNGQRLSNWNIDKQVNIVDGAYSQYLLYQVTAHSTADEPAHASGTFEFLTGYMRSQFTSFYTLDVKGTKQLAPIGHCGGGSPTCSPEQSLPLIFANADGSEAMGIYTRGLPQATFPNAGYGRFRFDGVPVTVTKWNAAYRYYNIAPMQRYSFVGYVPIGTLDQVKRQMQALYDSGK